MVKVVGLGCALSEPEIFEDMDDLLEFVDLVVDLLAGSRTRTLAVFGVGEVDQAHSPLFKFHDIPSLARLYVPVSETIWPV